VASVGGSSGAASGQTTGEATAPPAPRNGGGSEGADERARSQQVPSFAAAASQAFSKACDLRAERDEYASVMAARDGILTAVARLERQCALDALEDPVAPEVYNDIWMATARNNTRVYETVFPGVIQDAIKTMKEWQEREQLPPRTPELLDAMVGHLVLWPTKFLEGENLASRPTEKEYFVPHRVMQ
jgi:hypothetical protein